MSKASARNLNASFSLIILILREKSKINIINGKEFSHQRPKFSKHIRLIDRK